MRRRTGLLEFSHYAPVGLESHRTPILPARYVYRLRCALRIERRDAHSENSAFAYEDSLAEARKNFSERPNTKIIVGPVPETLSQVDAKSIAYLHLDMNCMPPEVAALNYLWERITPGAPILFDDYAYRGYREQKLGIDKFAHEKGVAVLSLPTGQGLLLKPPNPT